MLNPLVLSLFDLPSSEKLLSALGRSHIMLVHFPIALIYMAALAEGWHSLRKQDGRSQTAFACLGVGAVAALAAAGVGWLHAELEPLGSSVQDLLFRHRWLGVASATGAVLSFCFALFAHNSGASRRFYRWLLIATLGTLTVGAHMGGSLVYGSDYLFGYDVPKPKPAPAKAPAEAASEKPEPETVAPIESLYSSRIRPLFEQRCSECHGAKKQKGDLRLDDLTKHFAEDPTYWVIQPGDALDSELYQRIVLPEDDDDVMPAKGEHLTAEEIALVKQWIDTGAEWEPTIPGSTE